MQTDLAMAEPISTAPDPTAALLGDLEESEDYDSLWDHFSPEVPFFTIALMHPLLRRRYHALSLEGPFHAKDIAEDYRARIFRSEKSLNSSGHMKVERLLICVGDGVFAHLESTSVKLFAPTPEAAEAAASQFRRYLKPQTASKPRFYIICLRDYGPSTETVLIERSAPVTTEELALNYGVDFPAWEQQWTQRMCRTASGLSILHGPPGCGKTSYLRALMSRLIDKSVFYFVPVSEAQMLSSPTFVNFWVEQTRKHGKKQKIAILEDGEELLLPRDGDSRDKVSNLLNIADGFLGDYLGLQGAIKTVGQAMNKAQREADRRSSMQTAGRNAGKSARILSSSSFTNRMASRSISKYPSKAGPHRRSLYHRFGPWPPH
jgi:hypothetical protein